MQMLQVQKQRDTWRSYMYREGGIYADPTGTEPEGHLWMFQVQKQWDT